MICATSFVYFSCYFNSANGKTNVIESTRKRTKHCFGNSGANVFFSLGMEFVVQSAWCRLPLP